MRHTENEGESEKFRQRYHLKQSFFVEVLLLCVVAAAVAVALALLFI